MGKLGQEELTKGDQEAVKKKTFMSREVDSRKKEEMKKKEESSGGTAIT